MLKFVSFIIYIIIIEIRLYAILINIFNRCILKYILKFSKLIIIKTDLTNFHSWKSVNLWIKEKNSRG